MHFEYDPDLRSVAEVWFVDHRLGPSARSESDVLPALGSAIPGRVFEVGGARDSGPSRERVDGWVVAADGVCIRAFTYVVAAGGAAAPAPLPACSPAFLFVYGTLRRGESRHALLEGARYARDGTVEGELVDLGDYPGLVAGPGRVTGELFAIGDPALLRALDQYEGFHGFDDPASLYHRGVCRVLAPDGTRVEAWTYFYRGDRSRARRLSGDWCRR
jgi:gamma-glutamylcyclotransferase (GGCT)/AIG2-like uncharacterized protein YtfP